MKIYFVSNFGDINIEQIEDDVILRTTELTTTEEEILKKILEKYKNKIADNIEDLGKTDVSLENKSFIITHISINDVHKFMKSKLKRGKNVLTAIKFKDGRTELTEELKDKDISKIEKGATVDKPRRGCPMPELLRTEMRASKVLKEFLTEQQIQDFDRYRSFISTGNYTGRNYMITSRWSPKVESYGQVYDLVNRKIICANCMEILPSEEMLSLKFSVELNEREFLKL